MKKEYIEILEKSTILLVEDNLELQIRFKNILDTYVDKVYTAQNGEEAIELFNKHKPNIVITDYKMSVMNGLEFTSFIRRINKQIPIVIISAYTDKDALIEFNSLHLTQYLVKPIDYEELNIVLQKCAKELIEKGLIEVILNDTTIYSYSKKALVQDGAIISLSPNEIVFLELLLNNKNKLVSIETIEYEVYDSQDMTSYAINNLVSKLRKKIGKNSIKNIPKTGFIFINE